MHHQKFQMSTYPAADMMAPPQLSPGSMRSLFAWSGYWICAWIGTTIAGVLFAIILALFPDGEPIGDRLLGGLTLGICWAGGVGAVVIPHLAIAHWMFWFNRSDPGYAGAFAGGLVGAICGIIFLPITAPMGWFGAFYACRVYTGTKFGKQITLNVSTPWRFSMKDLFLRMTVIAIVLAFWIGIAGNNRRANRIRTNSQEAAEVFASGNAAQTP